MKSIVFAVILFLICGFFGEISAHPSWAIVVDDKEQIYVSDLSKIWKIDAQGKVSVFAERHTHEMTFDKDGNLLGEEMHYEPSTRKFTASLWRITPNGEFSYIHAPSETLPKGLSNWKNQSGATFYLGQTQGEAPEFYLLKREANGSVKVLFGDKEKAMREPEIAPYSYAGMAFAPDGSLYAKSSSTIWKAAPDDKVTVFVDEKQLSAIVPKLMLFGLTVDAENNVYTADLTNKKVLKIAPDKRISVALQSEANWSPTGVYAKNKNLYVLEIKNVPVNSPMISRVRKIASDGKASTIATVGENQTNPPANQNSVNSISENQQVEEGGKICASVGFIAAACICSTFFKANYEKV